MRTVKKPCVYHVGYMDIRKKNKYSHEGTGLSVSTCPAAWCKISETTGGPTNTLRKKDGRFLVATSLSKKNREEIIAWGERNGYVKKTTVYQAWSCDEYGDDYFLPCLSYNEALEEACDDPDSVKVVKDIIPTEKMNKVVGWKIDISSTFDLLVTLYAEAETDYDGVWWNEILDVVAYSAPRGVIFNSRLSEWSVSQEKKRNVA